MTMNRSRVVAVVAVAAVSLVLGACGASDASSSSRPAERRAGAVTAVRACITNNTSGTLQGTASEKRTAAGEGEFRAEPGQRACVDGLPGSNNLSQSVMSREGPSWRIFLTVLSGSYTFNVCGEHGSSESVRWDLECGGNPYRFTGSATKDAAADRWDYELVFADR